MHASSTRYAISGEIDISPVDAGLVSMPLSSEMVGIAPWLELQSQQGLEKLSVGGRELGKRADINDSTLGSNGFRYMCWGARGGNFVSGPHVTDFSPSLEGRL